MSRDLKKELEMSDTGWATTWKPNEGDSLIGVIRNYTTPNTPYGPCRVAEVETEEGSRFAVWLQPKVLVTLFEQERPQVGDRIGLRYTGKHPTKKYRQYNLVVERKP